MPVKVSVVVPTHNERENVGKLHERLGAVFAGLKDTDFELIFCDDSTDDTPAAVAVLNERDPRVKLIRLSRRHGQSVAISAGIDHSSGDAVVLMDADLQDPPEALPRLIEKWRAGAKVVYVRRPSGEGHSSIYRWLAFAFYRLLNRLSSTPVPVDVGEFRLLDKKVARVVSRLPEHTRYLREMTVWPGFQQASVDIERAPRAGGDTKYDLWRSTKVAVDGIISSSIIPLRLAVWTGLIVSSVSFILGMVYLVWKLVNPNMLGVGWTSLFLTLLFMGGLQLIFLGVIGEYIGRIFIEVRGRPLYVVDYCLGLDEREPAGRPS